MNRIEMGSFQEGHITITVDDYEDSIRINFDGSMDLAMPQTSLKQYYNEIHEKVANYKLSKIYLNFIDLVFINSSCIRYFFNWLSNISTMPSSEKYTIEAAINSSSQWQKESFKIIFNLFGDFVTIKEVNKAN